MGKTFFTWEQFFIILFSSIYANQKYYIKSRHRYFTHSFSLGKIGKSERLFTGVNFDTLTPCKTFGDSRNMGRNDAVLFEFSKDMEKLTIYFFFEQGNRANEIFDLWTAGKICMTVDTIPTVKEKPADGQNV